MVGILILLYAIDAVSGGLVPQGCFVAAWVYVGLSFIIGAAGKSSVRNIERNTVRKLNTIEREKGMAEELFKTTVRSSGKDTE